MLDSAVCRRLSSPRDRLDQGGSRAADIRLNASNHRLMLETLRDRMRVPWSEGSILEVADDTLDDGSVGPVVTLRTAGKSMVS